MSPSPAAACQAVSSITECGTDYLYWVACHPLVTAPIAGPSRTSEHLRLVREALTVLLDEHSRDRIGSWFAEH
jgi:aryl-alcohol dehydrogenase-like predicted oxidoreductase